MHDKPEARLGQLVAELDMERKELERGFVSELQAKVTGKDVQPSDDAALDKPGLPETPCSLSPEDMAARFPFLNTEISHPSGTLIGVNLQTDTPIHVDFFDRSILEGGPTTVMGRAGKGHGTIIRAPSGDAP